LGPSKSPDIAIFKRFQSQWEFVDKSSYQTVSSDDAINRNVSAVASGVVAFANA